VDSVMFRAQARIAIASSFLIGVLSFRVLGQGESEDLSLRPNSEARRAEGCGS